MEIFKKLPFDLQSKILIMRPTHKLALILKKHYNSFIIKSLINERLDMLNFESKREFDTLPFEELLICNPFYIWYFLGKHSVFYDSGFPEYNANLMYNNLE